MCYMGRFGSVDFAEVDFGEVLDVCSREYHFEVTDIAAAAAVSSCTDSCFRRSFENEDVRIKVKVSFVSLSLFYFRVSGGLI